ncbi:hypothetical protein [Arthrobacter sp. Soil763]|uniref:hypothetical protein n=1 Tax=Arthrobacter sp. Soil763 TaxID=1736402 RepID=UPI000ADBA7CA|nr:hypothetical protein [Arthrobacter sp. Soil763]
MPLRPLLFGEIVDGAFQAVRRNPAAMLGAGVIAQALGSVTTAVVRSGVVSTGPLGPWLESLAPADAVSLGLGVAGAAMLLSLLAILLSVVMQGFMAVPVARSLLNRPTGFRQMWTLARSRTGALLALAVVLVLGAVAAVALAVAATVAVVGLLDRSAGVLLVILFPLLAVVLLWLAIRFQAAPSAIAVEELGAFAGLRRSWHLTGGHWWRIFGITLVVGLLVGVITQVILIPVNLLGQGLGGTVFAQGGDAGDQAVNAAVVVLGTVVAALVAAVGFAFQTSTVALVYLDLRMRKDGLDLALMRQLESGAEPGGVPGRTAAADGGSRPWPPAPGWPPVRG